ncbi:MAG: hypothetical protein R3352_00130 [Salinisphaeraceae bacterium]|nr:hypothetical protein [Salinisphaeraceae bacterium]
MKNVVHHSYLGTLEEEGLLSSGIQRELSTNELASYAQAAPELTPMFDAMIGNHDAELAEHLDMQAMRAVC